MKKNNMHAYISRLLLCLALIAACVAPLKKNTVQADDSQVVWDYDYSGSTQTFTAPVDGTYKLEAWGSSGQDIGSHKGGRGGYSSGTINLNKGDKLYIYVGNNDTQGINDTANNQSWGFNGGGLHEPNFGASGGGATDFRITAGAWNDDASLKSRIIVAGGGGGANARMEGYGEGDGGAGGGTNGIAGQSLNHSNYDNGVFGYGDSTPGTQTNAGEIYWHHAGNDGESEGVNEDTRLYRETQNHDAGFGFGGTNQSGGGGGWYGGGAGQHCGASGGSGYVSSSVFGRSMMDGTQTITEPSGQKAIGHTGNGYARIIRLITYAISYNLNGGLSDNIKSYSNDHDAFTLNKPVKSGYVFTGWTGSNGNTPQTDVTISKDQTGDLSFTANWAPNSYIVTIPTNISYINMNVGNVNQTTDYDVNVKGKINSNSVVVVTAEKEKTLNNNQGTASLTAKAMQGKQSWQADEINKNEGTSTKDTIKISGYVKTSDKWTGTVKYMVTSNQQDFGYTGSVQTFIASRDGKYKLEVWGSSGQDTCSHKGGRGGYSVGTIKISKGDKLYVYVGNNDTQGLNETGNETSWGFNGGGLHEPNYGASGGGATDIRTTSGAWNDDASLKSRIIVAGGGGGANARMEGYGEGDGGAGGGESGLPGTSVNHTNYDNNWYSYVSSNGGTQTEAGRMYLHTVSDNLHFPNGLHDDYDGQKAGFYPSEWNNQNRNGTVYHEAGFGFGGTDQSGGGGGYYGGSAAMHGGGAGGSGHVGTILTDAQTIAGNQSFPSPSGVTETGHTGNGFARITYIGS